MRLEIIIDKKHQIPTSTMEALRQALLKQLGETFPDLHVRVAPGSTMSLTVSRASKEDKERAEAMVQEVWENADSWMPEESMAS
ncbi:DinI family protein [Aeromonas cavernicola]|uniref:DinI family protein n=1 Tax=Aeromonas cavernicola TaxID=1006623 RepID=A0A2H9U311_9GAMM|nr:DinI family protein [Aeromonas cavernicola]PJG58390.1 DinI family protein [Aeromonas cavernicola]